jgi:hypothetical protein
VAAQLNLSYKNARELNALLDKNRLTPEWKFTQFNIKSTKETHDLFFRDPLECIKKLYGDADLARYMVYAPEQHFSDNSKTEQLYHDVHTGEWWWDKQVCNSLALRHRTANNHSVEEG